MLGLSASTYNYYESSRVPPADVLVRIADVAGVGLRWLLTGRGSRLPSEAALHPAVARAAEMLARRPDAAEPLAAFLDILEAATAFPPKHAAAAPPGPEAAKLPPTDAGTPIGQRAETPRQQPAPSRQWWIPVLGRTAAGVPHFWASKDEAATVTTLAELVARHAAARPDVGAAEAEAVPPEPAAPASVQFVTLRQPAAEGPAEFVASEPLKRRHADAFALRIDGDSMAPELRHGDVVVLSPSAEAAEGRPAVVQLADQIGVTCKLYRRAGQTVHLVPVNEQYAVQTFPAERVIWALRVLARVR